MSRSHILVLLAAGWSLLSLAGFVAGVGAVYGGSGGSSERQALSGTAAMIGKPGEFLCQCIQFSNTVICLDAKTSKEAVCISLGREPIGCVTLPGGQLLVAHHLPVGRADQEIVAAVVSVIDAGTRSVTKELPLPNGSTSVAAIGLSPDGKVAAVTHLVATFNRAATDVRLGWMNANALTLIDTTALEILGTVLLDYPGRGAANPWGLAWSSDGQTLAVALSGVHEVSLIEFPPLVEALQTARASGRYPQRGMLRPMPGYEGLAERLPFLATGHRRIKLPPSDLGLRTLSIVDGTVYATNYFSENVTAIDLASGKAVSLAGPNPNNKKPESLIRKGERLFHDATLCLEGWQSCASCHPGGGRMDALNWDLVNDGIGNPKNTKSLVWAHKTAPAMSLGVRDSASSAVRAGIRHILFTEPDSETVAAMDAYLASLEPLPSPHLVNGQLSVAARRGEGVFKQAGCATCHPPGLFTDRQAYDVGTEAPYEKPGLHLDTPTLVELWRTAPYLHDGSAATLREALTTRNPKDQHGKTSKLTTQQIDDLCAYLLSL